MAPFTADDLLTLEDYASERPRLRAQAIAHKRLRTVRVGDHLSLLFEDAITVRYHIQEMLRVERVCAATAIQDELDTYNPLIPDGSNWKATLLIEYADPQERRAALIALRGVEHCVYVQVAGFSPIYPIADEDLTRENDTKTSAVHFLRFELNDALKAAVKAGAALSVGCDHPDYTNFSAPLPEPVRASLCGDLN